MAYEPEPGFPLTHTHTHTHTLLCFHLSLLHTQTHSCLLAYLIDYVPSKAGALPETTNKVSYLPLVPALFCQVTTLVSLLLSASLTLLLPLPLSLSLFLCFSPSLTLPSPPLPPLPLSFGGQACLLGLFPDFFPSGGHSGSFSPSARLRASEV